MPQCSRVRQSELKSPPCSQSPEFTQSYHIQSKHNSEKYRLESDSCNLLDFIALRNI